MRKHSSIFVAVILGTRPEIIKLSPIIRELKRRNIRFFILHTNQHYSRQMDAIFLHELELPKAKYNLGINADNHGRMVGEMLMKIEDILMTEKPSHVIVQGDTNTTLAGALAASKIGITVLHIEAGLRSYDRTMPEELNRVAADHFADLLFCPTERQAMIAIDREGIDKNTVFVTGNTIVDSLYQNQKIAKRHAAYKHYRKENYFLVTMHRPSNVDDENMLRNRMATLEAIADKFETPIYFPIHPRTAKQIERFHITFNAAAIIVMQPVGYLEMLTMMQHAKLILTDSGGLQEEACILHVPCVTLRDNTERPETVEVGANIITGNDQKKVLRAVNKMLKAKRNWYNPFGDGKSSQRICRVLIMKS